MVSKNNNLIKRELELYKFYNYSHNLNIFLLNPNQQQHLCNIHPGTQQNIPGHKINNKPSHYRYGTQSIHFHLVQSINNRRNGKACTFSSFSQHNIIQDKSVDINQRIKILEDYKMYKLINQSKLNTNLASKSRLNKDYQQHPQNIWQGISQCHNMQWFVGDKNSQSYMINSD